MPQVYSASFKPRIAHVVELLQLIGAGNDRLSKLKPKTKMSPKNVTDYLAFFRLTYLVTTEHFRIPGRKLPRGKFVTYGDHEKIVGTTYALSPLGADLLRAHARWIQVFELNDEDFSMQVTDARLDWENTVNRVREHPDFIGDKLVPEGFSVSVLHPEY